MVHIEHRDMHQHFYQYKPFLEMIDDHDLTMEVLRLPEHVGEGEVRRLILRGGDGALHNRVSDARRTGHDLQRKRSAGGAELLFGGGRAVRSIGAAI